MRGNLAGRTDFATVNSAGSGVLDSAATLTNFIYDAYGRLLQTIQVHSGQANPNAVLSSFAYDGMGRQISRIDASGSQTTTYNDAQHQIVVSNSSTGLSQVSLFDARGRLVSVTQSDLNAVNPSAARETEYLYDADGQLTLGDEVCTPDSSRFWPADQYEPGRGQPSFDKQFVRDWASSTGWDRNPPAPAIPDDVVARTREKYVEAYERIVGDSFDEWLRRTGAA